jgi:probable rRNA maturation factor
MKFSNMTNSARNKVIIENEQDKKNVDAGTLKLLEITVCFCLEELDSFNTGCEICITLVDDERICEINRQFRKVNASTDVLSFPIVNMHEGSVISEEGDYDIDEGLLLMGDIVISLEKAQKQAEEYGHSYERELAFLTSHGCLHLMGYDHENKEQEMKMLVRQEMVLNKMGLKRE